MFGIISKKEIAKRIPFTPEWDKGAPLPHLLQSEYKTFLTYYVNVIDSHWDGTYVKMQDPNSPEIQKVAIVEWIHCKGAVLGGFNDEAISGHRLWDKGLSGIGYGAALVQNSNWINELRKGNRVHPYHKEEMFTDLKHFILLFHDTTFECIAESYDIQVLDKPMPEVLRDIIDKLN